MTFTALKPLIRGSAAKSGIRASAKISNAAGKEMVCLSFNAKAQEDLFEGPIAGRRFDLEVGQGPDRGRIRIREAGNGAFTPRSLMKGAALFYIRAWHGLADGIYKPADCEAEDVRDGIVIRLPDWAQPDAAKAAMEAKFGLKPAGSAGAAP